MSIYVCKVCGHVEFNSAPEKCPVCFASNAFSQNDRVFIDSEEKSKEAAIKHIPQIKVVKSCGIIPEEPCTDIIVRVGEKLHPMEEKHFITFIDCYIDDKYATRVMLTPTCWASTVIHIKNAGKKVTIVENCNIHGYWMSSSEI